MSLTVVKDGVGSYVFWSCVGVECSSLNGSANKIKLKKCDQNSVKLRS